MPIDLTSLTDLDLTSFQVFPRNSEEPQAEILSHPVFNIEIRFEICCWRTPILYSKSKEDVLTITYEQFSERSVFELLIRNKLSSIEGVSMPDFREVADKILGCAHSMVEDLRNIDRRVFYIGMEIINVVVSPDVNVHDGTWTAFDASDRLREFQENLKVMKPSDEESIQELEIVNVNESTIATVCYDCRICMEEIGVGSKARRMPCEHLFHDDCIVTWLRESNSCPLCRFELP